MNKQYADDDGRVICDMNVEGMSWYNQNASKVDDYRRSKARKAHIAESGGMTRSEALRYTFYAVLAGLTIVAVFAVAWILLWQFAVHIWFR